MGANAEWKDRGVECTCSRSRECYMHTEVGQQQPFEGMVQCEGWRLGVVAYYTHALAVVTGAHWHAAEVNVTQRRPRACPTPPPSTDPCLWS
jgi:hypothetical protein